MYLCQGAKSDCQKKSVLITLGSVKSNLPVIYPKAGTFLQGGWLILFNDVALEILRKMFHLVIVM